MYSDAEIDAAVRDGALAPEAALAFRAHVARARAGPVGGEEHVRLVTGFNDIFTGTAAALALAGLAWLAGSLHAALGGAAVALASWALAEYFTRRRRMAFPSLLLLAGFAGGVFQAAFEAAGAAGLDAADPAAALAGACAALAAGLHWRRFRVPAAVAAGAGALVAVALALTAAAVPEAHAEAAVLAAMFLAGAGVFALAMRRDLSDRERATRRADTAFWLHLLAAPLIVHPAFSLVGEGGGAPGPTAAVALLYALLAVIALAVDRRPLLFAALAYLLTAIYDLTRGVESVGSRLALAILVAGAALLLLSAFWRRARSAVLRALPASWQAALPASAPPAPAP